MRPATAIPNERQAIQIETEGQELFLLERQNQNYRKFTMATSNKLTDKRLKEIAALPVTYDDDIPVLEALKAQGKDYQTRINSILREAVFHK